MERPGIAVYLMASRKYGTIYTGVTSNIIGRTYQHRTGIIEGFTRQYGVHLLVWYEIHDDMESAICREKRIKKYMRYQKVKLIESTNPEWLDLWQTFTL